MKFIRMCETIVYISSTGIIAMFLNDRSDEHTSRAQEPAALPDMGVFVLQVSVRPDQALRGKHHLVSSLLELLEQFFGTGGKHQIKAVSNRE